MSEAPIRETWKGDLLEYAEIGHAFANLIKSLKAETVISIEAGFGRGKTFFRKAWAQQLKQEGEVVVEVDAQQSDHSGDPVITLLGALVDALPKSRKSNGKKVLDSAKKVGAIGGKALMRAILKAGADEVIEVLTDSASDQLEDFAALEGIIEKSGEEMSKLAGQIIASQMATEKMRKVELPKQLKSLRESLVGKAANKRVLVIIDELDRCHPEYAISFLEATKVIFGQSGFVFVLMMNAQYLESLARHRFGAAHDDEKYLDKFVDIRLKLEPKSDVLKTAIHELACDLPLNIPYGDGEAFSVKATAELAGELAIACGFSMRKTKRILLKVDLALRCYRDRPLDAPLLVLLAFQAESPGKSLSKFLPRSLITPEEGERQIQEINKSDRSRDLSSTADMMNRRVREIAPELLKLPRGRYHLPDDGKEYHIWAKIFSFLAPHYIPAHQSVLDAVASVMVSESQGAT